MINKNSFGINWIKNISKKIKADKILVEKVIRALALLEGLAKFDLDFCFKGGTACLLLLDSAKRMSIDIDIIVPDKQTDLSSYIETICKEYDFTRYDPQKRNANTKIDKEHFKLYFTSVLSGKESHILLDVLREDLNYHDVVRTPVSSPFVQEDGEVIMVRTPDFNNILADKLTAFAPNTTGIPYWKNSQEMGMEIIKQLYDIGSLFDKADDADVIASVFKAFAKIELGYREYGKTIEDVLTDIINTSLTICLRKNQDDTCNWNILNKGLTQVRSYIFSETFHIEKATTQAAKAAYLAILIRNGIKDLVHYTSNVDMKLWNIMQPFNSKLNKIKKTNPEAFFYLYQMYLVQKQH